MKFGIRHSFLALSIVRSTYLLAQASPRQPEFGRFFLVPDRGGGLTVLSQRILLWFYLGIWIRQEVDASSSTEGQELGGIQINSLPRHRRLHQSGNNFRGCGSFQPTTS